MISSTSETARDVLPYMGPEHRPVESETEATRLRVVQGKIPDDLQGVFCRNSGNPQFPPKGRYHWFDGDGMVHSVAFAQGQASYRNRWVRTAAFRLEQERGRALWGGLLDPIEPGLPTPIKDTANTDITYFRGELLATWWLSGTPYRLAVPSLETLGAADFGGKLKGTFSAHPKVDPFSGELVFMSFSLFKPPYIRYGVVDALGQLVHHTPIDVPHPHVPHDLALTKNYTILLDMPLGWDPQKLREGRRIIAFDRNKPTRLGVIPRRGQSSEVKWFEVDSCYVYHTINAYEDAGGDEIVLYACRVENPIPSTPTHPSAPYLDTIELWPLLYRWRLNLRTGQARGEVLDETATEFPRTCNERLTTPLRYSYNPRVAPQRDLVFDGFIKYDLERGTNVLHRYPAGWVGGEVVFVPRPNTEHEDDGYILTIITQGALGRSRCLIIDAKTVSEEPVATIELPWRVPTGFHACWAPLTGLV